MFRAIKSNYGNLTPMCPMRLLTRCGGVGERSAVGVGDRGGRQNAGLGDGHDGAERQDDLESHCRKLVVCLVVGRWCVDVRAAAIARQCELCCSSVQHGRFILAEDSSSSINASDRATCVPRACVRA